MDITEISPLLSQESSELQSLNKWILDIIGPYMKGRVLEMNSGIHSLCPLFIAYNRPIHLSHPNPSNVQLLKETYKVVKAIRDIHEFDFMDPDFQHHHPNTLDAFDTVLALQLSMSNFITSINNIKYVMPKQGTLVMVLPADTYLYSGLAQDLEDWKKYNWKIIGQIIAFGFAINKVRYFNSALDKINYEFAHSGLSAVAIFSKK